MCPSGQSLTQADVFLRILATLLGNLAIRCMQFSKLLPPLAPFHIGPEVSDSCRALLPLARVKTPACENRVRLPAEAKPVGWDFGAAARHRRCAAARRRTGKTRAARRRSSQAPGALFQWAAQGAESIDPGRPVATGMGRGAPKNRRVCACVRRFPLNGAGQLTALSPSRYPSLP